jgi:hypothetical protein
MKKYIIALFLMFSVGAFATAQEKTIGDRVKLDDDQSYLILSTKKIQTLEKELDEVAAKGFRVLYGAPTVSFDLALFLKRGDRTESQPYSYKILATSRLATMEKELNEQAVKGFRLLPRTTVFKQGLLTAELVTIMEREFESKTAYEYRLVWARKEEKLQSKIDALIGEGFAPVTMITLGENVIIMEKINASK